MLSRGFAERTAVVMVLESGLEDRTKAHTKEVVITSSIWWPSQSPCYDGRLISVWHLTFASLAKHARFSQ